jgi:hypothetical protein
MNTQKQSYTAKFFLSLKIGLLRPRRPRKALVKIHRFLVSNLES